MVSWFCDRLRLWISFVWPGIYMTAERAVMLVKKVTYFVEFGYLSSSCITKSIILMFLSSSRDKFRFRSKTQWQIVLLVSGRHVGTHLDGHQHGFSIQIAINLGKKSSAYLAFKKNCCDLNLSQSLYIFTIFVFPDSRLYLLNSFDFYFDMAWHWKPVILVNFLFPF